MIWVVVILCILGYILVGAVSAAIVSVYVDNNEVFTALIGIFGL